MSEPFSEKDLGDGRSGWVYPMTFGKGRLCIGPTDSGVYDQGFCYETVGLAAIALDQYDGTGEPLGWFKNLQTGQFQPEFTSQEIDPRFNPIAPTSSHFAEPEP